MSLLTASALLSLSASAFAATYQGVFFENVRSTNNLWHNNFEFKKIVEAPAGSQMEVTECMQLTASSGYHMFNVHGNQCNMLTPKMLPVNMIIPNEKFTIGNLIQDRNGIENQDYEIRTTHGSHRVIYTKLHVPGTEKLAPAATTAAECIAMALDWNLQLLSGSPLVPDAKLIKSFIRQQSEAATAPCFFYPQTYPVKALDRNTMVTFGIVDEGAFSFKKDRLNSHATCASVEAFLPQLESTCQEAKYEIPDFPAAGSDGNPNKRITIFTPPPQGDNTNWHDDWYTEQELKEPKIPSAAASVQPDEQSELDKEQNEKNDQPKAYLDTRPRPKPKPVAQPPVQNTNPSASFRILPRNF